MRHTLNEASMLEILAAAESDSRHRACPRSPEIPAGRPAGNTRAGRSAAADGEQGPVPYASGDDETAHGEQQIPLEALRQPQTGPAAGSRSDAARQGRSLNDRRGPADALGESRRASRTAILVRHQGPICDDCGLWWPI
jgi:hypothetical protein